VLDDYRSGCALLRVKLGENDRTGLILLAQIITNYTAVIRTVSVSYTTPIIVIRVAIW